MKILEEYKKAHEESVSDYKLVRKFRILDREAALIEAVGFYHDMIDDITHWSTQEDVDLVNNSWKKVEAILQEGLR